ncbi:MAG: hypothetical protein ACP5GZ_00375 [Vulcanisaeta sp.]|jgi:hypothetical protein|uniref:Uncharacterized protein n=1 Tax=Vulcanisaeta moutnovskia (strain 768-28) TaxID=985053 RepID=F0QT07_VULM7|nr:hypothetical protein [Vulcanisaeta moutnovskia]ADY00428.1 hypothetical protein VMUT_0212 [Vulcanisaeta moutnovskia 768-28]
MSKSRKTRRSQKRKGKLFYFALALVILGEAAFIIVLFLPGIVSKLTMTSQAQAELNATVITDYMLSTLINPYNNSLINATALGLVNNTKPILMYLTVNDPYLVDESCGVWPILYNATYYHGYNVVVIVFPNPPTQAPATLSVIQQFNNYVYELCNFNPETTKFIITTAFWSNYTSGSQVLIIGYGTLLPQLLTKLGINASSAYFPLLILVKPHNTVNTSGVIYGQQLINSTYLNETLFGSSNN